MEGEMQEDTLITRWIDRWIKSWVGKGKERERDQVLRGERFFSNNSFHCLDVLSNSIISIQLKGNEESVTSKDNHRRFFFFSQEKRFILWIEQQTWLDTSAWSRRVIPSPMALYNYTTIII